MAVIVRIVSADGKQVLTKAFEKLPKTLKVPAGAEVEVVDALTGKPIPVAAKGERVVAAEGESSEVQWADKELLIGEHEADVEIEPASDWADAQSALNALSGTDAVFTAAAAMAQSDLKFADADTQYEWSASQFGEGGSSLLLYGALGVAAVAGAFILLDDDNDDDDDGEAPDTTAPAAPTALDLAATDDTGALDTDGITSIGTDLTITGTAEAGSTVELFNGQTSLGTVSAGTGGTFSIDVDLPEGTHTITATATDAAGNESPASSGLPITVDMTAPAAPTGLAYNAQTLAITGTAAAGSTVELFNGQTSLGTATATSGGTFSFTLAQPLPTGNYTITAVATDTAGNDSAASAGLPVAVDEAVMLINASIDGEGDTVTLYFDSALAAEDAAAMGDFSVNQDGAVGIEDMIVAGNRITLLLEEPLAEQGAVSVSYAGPDLADFSSVEVTNRLDLMASRGIEFGRASGIALEGAEISAFDPQSDRIFITGADGIQVVQLGSDMTLTLLGTIDVGTNIITSVAVANGIVAVAVVAEDKTQPGRVYFIDADGPVGASSVLGSVEVGSLPDMVTFTPDGSKVFVANEGELNEEGTDPEGSISIIDLSGGVAAATVQTAGFGAFNDSLDELKAAGVRLFAGEEGFEDTTVAQDLEPEYIAVSADGTLAFVTLQENNAIAIVDIATATVTDIVPLGIKSFEGLLADFSDRDSAEGEAAINLTSGNPVFGQFMPDSISSFTGADGETYFVIANEGDDRDDFLPEFLDGFEESTRVKDLTLDPDAFPDADVLQEDDALGRLGVSQAPGNDGDTDGDGDVDMLLAYGARSFSILDAQGNIVFDSGSHIEQFIATGGLYDEDTNEGLFDDGRSDNKGPEPEGITTGVFGDSVLAFVTIERGGGGVMVYDVTNPENVEFVQYVRSGNDISPEGLVYVKAEDSPTGENILIVTNEVSATLTVYEITEPETYTLQLLHLADGEAKSLAIDTAPNLAAMVDAFEDDYVNSITLAGGDNFIPGLFMTAGTDASIMAVLPDGDAQGRVDIAIHNAVGVQASTIGNHEFDKGTGVFAGVIGADGEYPGAMFPYLSANLDFSGDSSLSPLFEETLGDDDLELARDLHNTIVPSAVIEENGELIGLVGATTQVLRSLTSLGGVDVKGTDSNDMELLAAQLQPYIDDLIAQGVNKVIVMSHLQQIELEQALAPLLEGVDIILAAGSNTRLADDDDELVAFTGHAAESEGSYPIVTEGADGAPTLIVNTDNEFTYLGRLVVEFDSNGELVLESLNETINGAYASTAENVAEAWGTMVDNLDETAFAEGTRGDQVRDLVNAVDAVLQEKGSNVYGYSDVYLEGARAFVRSEETNLGNLTADANAFVAREALGLDNDTVVVSYKNGGGIRDSIGSLTGTGSNVVEGPNEGGVVTELDVGATLAFNNGLIVFETTPEGLLNILNSPNVFQAGNGGFGQISGLEVSYDPDAPQGQRVVDVALVDGNGNKTALVDDGVVVDGAPSSITMVTLDFIAGNDGDGTQIAENGTNFRYITADGMVSDEIGTIAAPTAGDPDNIVVDLDGFTGEGMGEQEALALYLNAAFGSLEMAFGMEETSPEFDERIQNVNVREDTVLEGTDVMMAMMAMPMELDASAMTVFG